MEQPVESADTTSQIEALLEGRDKAYRDKFFAVLELVQEQTEERCRKDQARRARAAEADNLLAGLGQTHRDTLARVLLSARLIGRTVPPSLPPKANLTKSTSKNDRAREFIAGTYVPVAIAVLPTLNTVLGTELIDYLREILDPDLFDQPVVDLPTEKWDYVSAFLQLIQPEDARDCFPVPQNEDETEWHIAKLRAIFASFVRLVNAFSPSGTPRFVSAANSPKFEVFTPDGLFWIAELLSGEDLASMDDQRATPRLQFEGKRRDKDLEDSADPSPDPPSLTQPAVQQVVPTAAPAPRPLPSRASPRRSGRSSAAPPPSPSTLRATHPILSLPKRIGEHARSGGRSFAILKDFDIRETPDGKMSGQGVMVIKLCDVLLAGPPNLRLGNCCDADFSFNTIALSIYRQPPGDGPPPTKKRKLRQTDEALLERRFIKEDDAFAFALVASPLAENTDPGLLRALFSCIVPHRRLQRRVAEELVRQAQHPDLVRHVKDDLEGTFTPPTQLSSSLGAVPLQTHEDDPSSIRDAGSGGGPSGSTREAEGSMPPPGGSRGGDRGSGGGGQQSSGTSRMCPGGQLANESAVDEDDEAASSPLLAATSPLSHSSPATPPSSASSVKLFDAQEPQQCDMQRGGLGRLDYLAVSSPPLQVDYLPVQYRPPPAKPTRWIRSDQSETDASTVPEAAWTELAVIKKLPSSSEYHVVVAKSVKADTELVIKEEFLRYTDNDPMHTLRNEAATYDALAAAGLGSICAPYVGLYKVVDGKSKLALVTERWGEPLNDFNDLSEDERTTLGEMVLNLHNRGFYHGDFAARNVLVDSARKFRLIDWESSYRNHACPGHRRCAEVAEALEHLDLVVNDPLEDAA